MIDKKVFIFVVNLNTNNREIMKKEFIPVTNNNVFVTSEVKPISEISGVQFRKGLDRVVISENEVVAVVSNSYAHLPNEDFFTQVESAIIDAGFKYHVKAVNRDNRQFAVDYILDDDRFEIRVKGGGAMKGQQPDTIKPMLRFVNSYDGMAKTSGSFAFHRRVCTNGLMITNNVVGFKVIHKGDIASVVLPQIAPLIEKFTSNEYYELSRKFEVLAERPIKNLEEWVKGVADETKLFQYEMSSKNPEPSYNARIVLETIKKEAALVGGEPTAWLGYNAFNEVLHTKLKKGFDKQKQLDSRLFETVLNMN